MASAETGMTDGTWGDIGVLAAGTLGFGLMGSRGLWGFCNFSGHAESCAPICALQW